MITLAVRIKGTVRLPDVLAVLPERQRQRLANATPEEQHRLLAQFLEDGYLSLSQLTSCMLWDGDDVTGFAVQLDHPITGA